MDQAEQLRALIKQQAAQEKKEQEIKNPSNKKLANVITITSGKGGVGKTSIAINLAIQLAAMDKKVIIIDADMGLANVEVMLGIRPQYDLGDLMFGSMKLSNIITEGPMGIGFISGGSGINELNNLSKEQVETMTNRLFELDELADYVIVDTGAGITDTIMQFVKVSSQVLVVTTPEPTSITDAYAVLKALNRELPYMNGTAIKMISNRVGGQHEGEALYNKLNCVVEKFLDVKLDYLGAVVQDNNLSKGILNQQPVSVTNPNSASVKTIKILAEKIALDDKIVEKKGMAGFFTQFISSGLLFRKGEVK